MNCESCIDIGEKKPNPGKPLHDCPLAKSMPLDPQTPCNCCDECLADCKRYAE